MIPSNSPIIGMRRKGTYDDPYVPITETFTVRDGRVILTEIPDAFTHVTVSGYTEVYKNNPTATQFYVDYNLGIVYFNTTKNNTSLSFTYKGTGAVYFPASRIWTEVNGRDVTETLMDMITAGNDAIQGLADVDAIIDEANAKIAQTETARQNAMTATTNANTATSQANSARDSANTAATSANTAATSATTAASNANAAKASADTATSNANTAAGNANTATTNANTAVNNLLHLGTYSSATTYQPKNMVTYNNELWMCLVQSTNVTPVEGAKWRRMLTVADIVTNAQTATTNANTATTNANNAATYATTQGDYAKSKGDAASTVATNFNTAESGRVTAESNRVTAESGRASAESIRVGQESARVTAESTRSANETQRINAEGDSTKGRVKAENLRVSAETARASAETTRQTQEGTRQSQEATRQSQETDRQTNTTNTINNLNNTNTQISVWEAYNGSKTYKPLNKVSYNGSSYVCIVQCTGILPTDTSKWTLVSAKGADGTGTLVEASTTNGNVKINGYETPVYAHPAEHPASMISGLSSVATSGSYNDLDDKPAPFDPGTLATVATTGSYGDLSGQPTIPSKTSDLMNDSGFGSDNVNFQELTSNKTLSKDDARFQILYSESVSRDVILPVDASAGKTFVIYNYNDYMFSPVLTIKQGATVKDTIPAYCVKQFVFTGTYWEVTDVGSQGVNLSIGKQSSGYNEGVALGYSALGGNSGVTVGKNSNGSSKGTALGYYANTNSKNYAFAKGYYSKAERWNEEVKSSDGASATKYSYSTLAWHGQTTNATQTELFLGGSSNQRCTVLANSAFGFSIYVTALDNASGKAKRWKLEGLIKRDASNVTSLVGSVNKTLINQSDTIGSGVGSDTWDIVALADDTNEALVLKFTGEASKTIRIIARGEIEEVRF